MLLCRGEGKVTSKSGDNEDAGKETEVQKDH